MIEQLIWPPAYTIRKSKRARRVFLQILPRKGLEIVLPARHRNIDVSVLLNEKRQWIEKFWLRVMFSKTIITQATPILPSKIEFTATETTWQVLYQPTQSKPGFIKIRDYIDPLKNNILQVNGDIENISACIKMLKKWLIKKAKHHLVPWIAELSTQTELYYNHISVRGQSTLWGSCTPKKRINLNYKLLFLPKLLVQHILLHELCHLKHLNHSKSFWNLLKKWDINSETNNRLLRTAENYMPSWIL